MESITIQKTNYHLDNILIQRIHLGDQTALGEVYALYRKNFTQWLNRKYQVNEDEAIDLYQNTILILYDNIMQKKLSFETGSLKTYLFSIGRNKLMEKRRNKTRYSTSGDFVNFSGEEENSVEKKIEWEKRLDVAKASIHAMKNPCKKILQLYYYHHLSYDDIASVMSYKNAVTVKNQRYKCMERLRKMIQWREKKGLSPKYSKQNRWN